MLEEARGCGKQSAGRKNVQELGSSTFTTTTTTIAYHHYYYYYYYDYNYDDDDDFDYDYDYDYDDYYDDDDDYYYHYYVAAHLPKPLFLQSWSADLHLALPAMCWSSHGVGQAGPFINGRKLRCRLLGLGLIMQNPVEDNLFRLSVS